MPEYETVELSKDPGDYLNGPTGNSVNRTSGGTTRSGDIQVVTEDSEPKVTPSPDPATSAAGADSSQ